jgi:hypothetical protein
MIEIPLSISRDEHTFTKPWKPLIMDAFYAPFGGEEIRGDK